MTKSPFGDDAFPVLVGDIGGTNARFSVIENRQSEAIALPAQRTSDHHSFEDAVLASLEKSPFQPNTALLAAAGPLQHGVVDFTNSSWILDPHLTMTATGMPNCIILNDFEAQALVLPDLNAATDCVTIGPNLQPKIASKVVLGPGTGLGVAYLLRAGDAWIPVPGEGGHVSLAPENNDELALWRILLRDRSRVSAETLLAGRGLVVLHTAMAEMFGQKPDFTQPGEIVDGAAIGDQLCRTTLSWFSSFLGRVAGDFALSAVTHGGVYLSGGVSRKIEPYLLSGEFRTAFENKSPHQELMASIPTNLVSAPEPAIRGLAALARRPETFTVDLNGRLFGQCQIRTDLAS